MSKRTPKPKLKAKAAKPEVKADKARTQLTDADVLAIVKRLIAADGEISKSGIVKAFRGAGHSAAQTRIESAYVQAKASPAPSRSKSKAAPKPRVKRQRPKPAAEAVTATA